MTRLINILGIGLLLIACVMGAACTTQSAPLEESPGSIETVDMLEQTVAVPVPADIDGVLSTAPHVSMIIYMIAPDTLLGWNFPPEDEYISEKYAALPNVGGWYGNIAGNYESFIAMNPDVVFEGFNSKGDPAASIEERQANMGKIPVVGVENTIDALAYDAPITYVGSVLWAEEEAASLNEFYARVLALTEEATGTIPDDEKRTVYYANGPTGLKTSPSGSQHSQLIDICNGVNVAECPTKAVMGQTEVSMEQVVEWNPDVIVCDDKGFYDGVYDDPKWESVTAVKNSDVHYIPSSPYCWFDAPPSTNTIIGIPWVATVIYPDQCGNIDMASLTKEFYAKFYHYDLTDDEVQQLLNP
ncbi:ABC transporter substrate-binding protein [Methanogenium marinum]|uniref:ABC transporter substrate-binding protein n=1 Tax=Methanogenium marinum TaxID=348610 RepID=A0A9Q4PVL5_9EURY|nr:ABC transporter substrate-binding protein [Methanogenium marinum]MDE4907689.1 ABC transporter substrate-binding protein [Methanogenium marinum]